MFRILAMVLMSLSLAAQERAVARQKVLFYFPPEQRHINRVAALRSAIDASDGRIRAVLGLGGIVAEVQPQAIEALSRMGARAITDAAEVPRDADALTASTLAAWNRLLLPRRSLNGPRRDAQPETDVFPAPDLPRTAARRRAAEIAYAQHWESVRRRLPAEMQRSSSIGCGSNGAGFYDTSLYFAGDVAVSIFYANGTAGPWTSAMTTTEFANAVAIIDYFLDAQPNARLTFTYINEVDGSGLPLAAPSSAMERTHVNDLRSTWCTDWAFMATLKNGGVWPNANLFGPSLRMDTTFGPDYDDVLRHEIGHIFGAGDAYSPHSPASRYGYMMAMHVNACGSGGGFFGGTGECLDDVMASWTPTFGYNSIIGPSTAAQFGWLASGGDGLLDLMRTKPGIDGSTITKVVNTSTSMVTYNGVAFDRPPLNEQNFPYGDVSINRITAVQYRVNNGSWQDATASDAVWDSGSEAFTFTTPALPNGTYAVEMRAVNTAGGITPVPYSDVLVMSGSTVTNTRPFGVLTVTPQRALAGTTLTASAVASRDLEPGTLQYSWNWGTGWSPFATAATSTHVYTTPGTHTVQVRVRDAGSLIHVVTRSVVAEPYDVAPAIRFSATPEPRHFITAAGYTVSLSVNGSTDPETPFSQLLARWDVDCDGWDGPAALQKTKAVSLVNSHFQRSDRRCIRAQISDPAGNTTEADRWVWVVPYDHRPAVTSLTFTPSGPNYTMTVNATDADSATTWDGILEYRYDFDGDGVWDTTFDPTPTVTVTPAQRFTVIVQIRDRFDARVNWLWCSPFAC